MATTIFFNGRSTALPGSYTEVDASALAVVGLSAVGIVALIGEAEGGSPWNGDTPVHRFTAPGSVGRVFFDGDLREGAAIAFDPAKDPDIPGGAVEVVAVKVNPATRSTVTLLDAVAANSLVVTSLDYGIQTTQINIDISAGTTLGKKITIVQNDTTETFDDVGGAGLWTVQFTNGSNALSTATVTVDNTTGITGAWTEANTGLDGDISNPSLNEVARVVSSNAGDTTQTITLYGLDSSGDPQTETLTLNGMTPVVGTATWEANGILGAILSATTTGNITVDNSPTTGTTVISITGGTLTAGVVLVDRAHVMPGTTLNVAPSSGPAGARDIVMFGLNTGLAAKGEKITVNSPSAVDGTDTDWSRVTIIALGQGDAAITWTVTGNPFALTPAGYDTIGKVVNYINTLEGWVAAVSAIPELSPGTILQTELDEIAATNVLSPASGEFFADLALVVAAINNGSGLVSAAAATGASLPPANTANPVFLAGGVEGTPTITDWQGALDLLRDEFVSTIVPLTSDGSVHAAALAHCVYMSGAGRKERDMVVGGASGVVKTAALAGAVALNSRHARYCFQDLDRYNTRGEREAFPPYFMAAAVAGAQAGSPVGESLTSKYFNAIDVTQDSTFTLQDDANALVQSGLWFLERVQGVGFKNVRNITTHLIDNNLAYIEASVNEAVNFSVFNIRTNLEAVVGKKGFQANVNQAVSNIVDTLAALIDAEVIVAWRNLTVTLTNDTMTIDLELAPVIPINFIKTTVHLVSASFAAAA